MFSSLIYLTNLQTFEKNLFGFCFTQYFILSYSGSLLEKDTDLSHSV